jgi:ATPase subunit of ABC transporter with duplicated ATPase domains
MLGKNRPPLMVLAPVSGKLVQTVTLSGRQYDTIDCTSGWNGAPWEAPFDTVGASGIAKRMVVIAGPNGAGKTTFAREFLPREAGCPDFINVDLIAARLSPFAPERSAIRAGRLVLQEIRQRTRRAERRTQSTYR